MNGITPLNPIAAGAGVFLKSAKELKTAVMKECLYCGARKLPLEFTLDPLKHACNTCMKCVRQVNNGELSKLKSS